MSRVLHGLSAGPPYGTGPLLLTAGAHSLAHFLLLTSYTASWITFEKS